MGWGSSGYYNRAMPMMYWGNNPKTRSKGKQKGEHSSGRTGKRQDRRGEAYARGGRALKTNERAGGAKQMPLLGEFSSYSEWEKKPKGGPKHYITNP